MIVLFAVLRVRVALMKNNFVTYRANPNPVYSVISNTKSVRSVQRHSNDLFIWLAR